MKKTSTRSRALTGLLLGTAAFAMAGCQSEEDVLVVDADQNCSSISLPEGMTPEQCDAQIAAAQEEHRLSAPRYDAIEVCEAEHGNGACGVSNYQGDDGGSIIMPLLMGYMIGNMMNGNSASSYGRPLVSAGTGRGYSTLDNKARFSRMNGTAKVSSTSLTSKAPTTLGKPAMTKASVAKSGGFGASRTSTGGSRSFGG